MIDKDATRPSQPKRSSAENHSKRFAELFVAQVDDIIAQYRARLESVGSPLVSDPAAWEQCRLQARRIFDDCAESLSTGTPSATSFADVLDLGAERVRQGAHLTHSVRAGSILFELTTTALADCAARTDAPVDALIAAVRSLQQGIGIRLESGSIGYDAFLLQRVREVHEQGQRRLAREIHDHIGNSVSLALRQIELYEMECAQAEDASVSRHVLLAKDAVLETITRSRELVSDLRRSGITGSLETALRGFAASLGQAGIPLQMWVRGNDKWIPGSVTEELYIMVRECLRNVYAHAEATTVIVLVDIAPHEVHAEIIDNGRGFDPAAVRSADADNGLLGLRERCELIGGTMNLDSTPSVGTRVTLWIPISQESALHD